MHGSTKISITLIVEFSWNKMILPFFHLENHRYIDIKLTSHIIIYTCTSILHDRFWKLIYDLHKFKSLYVHLSSFQCERKTRYDQPIAICIYTSMFLRVLICTLCNTRKLSDLQDVSIRSIRYTICLNRSNVSQNSKV